MNLNTPLVFSTCVFNSFVSKLKACNSDLMLRLNVMCIILLEISHQYLSLQFDHFLNVLL